MDRTVIALYDSFSEAREAVEDLVDSGFDRSNISIVANDAKGEYNKTITTSTDETEDVKGDEGAGFGAIVGGLIGLGAALIPGIGPVVAAGPFAAALMAGIGAVTGAVTGGAAASLIDLGLSETDAHLYAEGLRRGGTMVTVRCDETRVDEAKSILNDHNPVDLEQRGSMYKDEGWTAHDATAQPYASDQMTTQRTNMTTERTDKTMTPTGDQMKFDVVEEELQVGKREVEKGGVRVRTYIHETPVEETVRLREEKVTVDRHPVDRPATEADLTAFKEGTMEMTERSEVPVVSKNARIVEEVVVGKEVTEREETVSDTVRRTDVEVEQMNTPEFSNYENDFRSHFTNNFSRSGSSYEQYRPAYYYGHTLANHDKYRGREWEDVEPEIQQEWESRNAGTWENYRDAIHTSWDRTRNRKQ